MFLWVEPLEVSGSVFSRTFVLKIVVSFVIAAFGMNVIVMDLAFLGLDPDRDHLVIGRLRCNSLICDREGISNLEAQALSPKSPSARNTLKSLSRDPKPPKSTITLNLQL